MSSSRNSSSNTNSKRKSPSNSTVTQRTPMQQGPSKMLRYATRITVALAVISAVTLPLLPSLTQGSSSRHQQLAQAAADRVAAGGGMLWLDDDDVSSTSTAE